MFRVPVKKKRFCAKFVKRKILKALSKMMQHKNSHNIKIKKFEFK